MEIRLAVFAIVIAGLLAAAVTEAVVSSADSQPVTKTRTNDLSKKTSARHVYKADAEAPVKLPRWWKAGDPVPIVKSNCVRCHLTAGRELTAPVQDFARSVHDLNDMTCSDCHGGNREKDSDAHDAEAGFIGTKLSAHMANCAHCHSDQAAQVKAGPHYWDFSKRINLDYPVCSDCHGHHDVAKPPVEFALKTVCTECHLNFEKRMPALASVVAENDRLWAVLRKVQDKNVHREQPVPPQFQQAIDDARHITAQLIHPAQKTSPEQAKQLNARVSKIRGELESWLSQQAASSAGQKHDKP
jgi:hypothetical protein